MIQSLSLSERNGSSSVKWVTPEDADQWSLEDPDKGGHEAEPQQAQQAQAPPRPHSPPQSPSQSAGRAK